MAGYEPDKLNAEEESAEAPDGEATITEINETVASEVYGDVDFDYDATRVMIDVVAETAEGQEVTESFALPESEKSWFNPNFKLGQFKEQYGSVPKEGMTVKTQVDEDSGFLSLDY